MTLHTKADGEGQGGQYLSVSPLFAVEGMTPGRLEKQSSLTHGGSHTSFAH